MLFRSSSANQLRSIETILHPVVAADPGPERFSKALGSFLRDDAQADIQVAKCLKAETRVGTEGGNYKEDVHAVADNLPGRPLPW